MRILSCFLAFSLLFSTGCSFLRFKKVFTQQDRERQLFSEVSRFYCDNGRWPLSWEELFGENVGSTGGLGDVEPLESGARLRRSRLGDLKASFLDPKISSPRAIVWTMEYKVPEEPSAAKELVGSSQPALTPTVMEQGSTTAQSANTAQLANTVQAATTAPLRRVTYIAPPSCAAASVPPVSGEVSIAGGRVRFTLPAEFSPLPKAAIKERWGDGPGPDVAWIRPGSDLIVAVRFGEAALTSDGMSKFKAGLESAYSRTVPGITWRVRELEASEAAPVLVHEFESDSTRGRLYTVAYSFSFDRRLVSLTIAGPAADATKIIELARAVRATLSLR